ncbi:hypothetical protein D7Y13_24410 [Corallococcus praedator]|uniref:Transmembrane protein n=1 Tax=Corallococcus praedator TaxID=2316724 RepID=A0ABX9QE29_9BACT|nr:MULTISPECIES: hypothetical protein [Corallococcus]RKH10000.1 hypothetical protein D7X74_28310 [Corallococcus sp. CA047B]RKH25473.1 hypothetical protein D7X75_30010 [Corallococcus sp. CA031C]RKI02499.1 hypothetical protein D7Y13_24410 [Corallococcus praedator]
MASIAALKTQARANWRMWLVLASTPIASLPLLGVSGSRRRRIGLFAHVASGAIGLGILSLAFMGLGRIPKGPGRLSGKKAWNRAPKDFPISGSMVPDEFSASMASGH